MRSTWRTSTSDRAPLPKHALLILLASASVGACTAAPEARNDAATNQAAAPAPAPQQAEAERAPPVIPPPGSPGALPDDRTPVSEAPFEARSPQGAADVVQTYYALIEGGKYAEARRLWSGSGEASGLSEAAFAASFKRFRAYHALVGAPGGMEGAAGSSYIEVPVQIVGRVPGGKDFSVVGPVRLRRVNDVPGATPEQLKWRIIAIEAVPPR
jgi:hypothetical protein